jgi:hypothetical protein
MGLSLGKVKEVKSLLLSIGWLSIFGHLALTTPLGAEETTILSVVSDLEVELGPQASQWELDDVLAIYGSSPALSEEILGFGQISKKSETQVLATVKTHSKSALIRPGARVVRANLRSMNGKLPARYDLETRPDRKISARYKPLVYTGFQAGQTASILGKYEHLLGPGLYAYGLHEKFQLETAFLPNFVGVYNLGGKISIAHNDEFRIAAQLTGQGDLKGFYRVGAAIFTDITSNSRFITHYRLALQNAVSSDSQATDTLKNPIQTELRINSGIMLGNWDRLIVGPKFNFDKKILGANLTYVFVWDHFHLLPSLASDDLTRLGLGDRTGTNFNLDFYWRF